MLGWDGAAAAAGGAPVDAVSCATGSGISRLIASASGGNASASDTPSLSRNACVSHVCNGVHTLIDVCCPSEYWFSLASRFTNARVWLSGFRPASTRLVVSLAATLRRTRSRLWAPWCGCVPASRPRQRGGALPRFCHQLLSLCLRTRHRRHARLADQLRVTPAGRARRRSRVYACQGLSLIHI